MRAPAARTVNRLPSPGVLSTFYLAAVRPGDPGHETEPEAQAPFRARFRPDVRRAIEAVEDVGQVIGGDAAPGVLDCQRDAARAASSATRTSPPSGVNFKALESRLESMRSIWMRSASTRQSGRQVGGEPHARRLGGNLELVHHVPHHGAQVQPGFLERQLAGFGLREQQQRAHDLGQPLDVLQRVEHGVAVLLRGLGGEQRHLQLAADGGDRRAQLVRNVGRELADLLEVSSPAARSCG